MRTLNTLIGTALLVAFAVGRAAAADVCPFDRNPGLNSAPFAKIYDLAKEVPVEKDQFQTSIEHEALLKRKLDLLSAYLRATQQNYGGLIGVDSIGIGFQHYDADHGFLTVSLRDRKYGTTPFSEYVKTSLGYDVNFSGLTISSTRYELDTYEAENAMGAKVAVTRTSIDTDAIAFTNGNGRPWKPSSLPSFKLRLERDSAKQAMDNLEIAVAGRPTSPYAYESDERSEPTFTAPTDETVHYRTIFLRPICFVVRDRRKHTIFFRWAAP